MANAGLVSSDERIVLQEAGDVVVCAKDGDITLYADRWEHPKGNVLKVFLNDEKIAEFQSGEWPGGCYAFGPIVKKGD